MMRMLECDCGFVVAGCDIDELVATAQAHAQVAHGMELEPDALVAAMVIADGARRRRDPTLEPDADS
jgi:predicted small metal-binding protein